MNRSVAGNYSEPGYLLQARTPYDYQQRQQSVIQPNRSLLYAQQEPQVAMRPDYSNLNADNDHYDADNDHYGADTRLADFVSKHNVVMDDGAVVYVPTDDGMARKRAKQRFVPCPLPRSLLETKIPHIEVNER
ncbi:unnamed protein product [Dibothriocephalus latus]|uniref:Uncharacterized protein n=1 Tax=Dibothriocephalus latus TaxID=60516 RepID=A0A3P7NN13_DIBLA|nr:unnamed protein product [Dibothriocephalus latus]